jgi:hypothetical protein
MNPFTRGFWSFKNIFYGVTLAPGTWTLANDPSHTSEAPPGDASTLSPESRSPAAASAGARKTAVVVVGGFLGSIAVGALTEGAGRAASSSVDLTEAFSSISGKLDYLFGKARLIAGNPHNYQRSIGMLRVMERIGLPDTAENRGYVSGALLDALQDPSSIASVQANGRVVRESLLMGPNGGAKLESVWQGNQVVTLKVFGSSQ